MDGLESVEILHEGHVQKKGNFLNKEWRRRWFILKSDNCLYYYEHRKDAKPRGCIALSNVNNICRVRTYKEYSFDLVSKKRVWHLAVRDESDLIDWMSIIWAMLNNALALSDIQTNKIGLGFFGGMSAHARRISGLLSPVASKTKDAGNDKLNSAQASPNLGSTVANAAATGAQLLESEEAD